MWTIHLHEHCSFIVEGGPRTCMVVQLSGPWANATGDIILAKTWGWFLKEMRSVEYFSNQIPSIGFKQRNEHPLAGRDG